MRAQSAGLCVRRQAQNNSRVRLPAEPGIVEESVASDTKSQPQLELKLGTENKGIQVVTTGTDRVMLGPDRRQAGVVTF